MSYELTPQEVCDAGMVVQEWFDAYAEELLAVWFPVESGFAELAA